MPTFETAVLLKSLRTDTERTIGIVKNNFLALSADDLNWKSHPDKWSIAECLEHLNIYSRHYLTAIEAVIQANADVSKSDAAFKSGWLGNYFAESMKLQTDGSIKSKMQTPKGFNPANSALNTPEVLQNFLTFQEKTLALLTAAEHVNLGKLRIVTSVSRFVTMKLGDTFRFVIYHNTRHIVQASNVLKLLKKR